MYSDFKNKIDRNESSKSTVTNAYCFSPSNKIYGLQDVLQTCLDNAYVTADLNIARKTFDHFL